MSDRYGSDPIHQPLLDDYRRRRGLPLDGSVGPSDAELKYGGLLFNATRLKNVSLNVVLLDSVSNTIDRDVFWFSAKMRANLTEEGFRPSGGDFQGMRIYRSDVSFFVSGRRGT